MRSLLSKNCFLIFAVLVSLQVSAAAVPHDLTIYVVTKPGQNRSPDCVSGRALPCVTSITQLQDLLSEIEKDDLSVEQGRVLKVRLLPGVHRVVEPLLIRWGKSQKTVGRLELTGEPGATISGAQVLPQSAVSQSNRLPKVALGHVQAVDVAGLAISFDPRPDHGFGQPVRPVPTEVFAGSKAMLLAGWPNAGYATLQRPKTLPVADKSSFAVAGRHPVDWINEPDLRVFAYWFWDWAGQSFAVKPITPGANFLELQGNGSPYGIKDGQRVRVENSLIDLDMPGEWYLDRREKKLYFWPFDASRGDYELSVAESLLVIEDAKNVLIQHIGFEKSRGDALVVRNSDNVVFDAVHIQLTGNRGLVVSGGSQCGFRNGLIEQTGEGGISLTGGNRQTLVAAGHFVENSTIRYFSRLSKTYRPAVALDGVGQRVQGNILTEAPHSAILFQGNDHRIVGNDISRVVQETSDSAAIYTGRDFTAQGTVIENNFIHDLQPDIGAREIKGILLDDQASGITIRNNVFARVQQPVFIGGGRDNVVEGNIFYDSSPAIHLDARGLHGAGSINPKGTLQTRLDAVPYRDALWAARYPHLANIREDDIGAPKYNLARGNVVVNGKALRIAKEAEAGIDTGGLVESGEDVFAKPVPPGGRVRREDFELKPSARLPVGKAL